MNTTKIWVSLRGHPLWLLPVIAFPGACAGAEGSAPDVGPVTTVVAEGASNPTVALDPRTGTRYVAWVGTEGEVSNVYVARAEAGDTTYSDPVRVNNIPGDASPHEQAPAQVAVGPEGTAYVLWQNKTPVEWLPFGASDLRLARSTDGGRTWSPAITVNDDAGGPPARHTFHDLAVAPDGTVYVSWIDARKRDRVRGERARQSEGQVEHAAHAHGGEPGTEIRVARSTDRGRSFGPSVVLETNSCPCCRTAIATGPDGAVYVAWRKIYEGSVRDIVVARAAPGTLDFSEPVRVHDDEWVFPGCPHAGPSVAVDASGRVHVGWYTGKEGRQGLWYAVSEDRGQSFGEPIALLTDEWVPPSQIKLGAAGDRVWIAWDDRREEQARWFLARTDGAEGLERIEGAGEPGTLPAVAVADGRVAVAWLDGEAVRVRRVRGAE